MIQCFIFLDKGTCGFLTMPPAVVAAIYWELIVCQAQHPQSVYLTSFVFAQPQGVYSEYISNSLWVSRERPKGMEELTSVTQSVNVGQVEHSPHSKLMLLTIMLKHLLSWETNVTQVREVVVWERVEGNILESEACGKCYDNKPRHSENLKHCICFAMYTQPRCPWEKGGAACVNITS